MLAISTYQWLLSFHIILAVLWVGGGMLLTLLALFAVKSSLPGRKAEFATEAAFVGSRVFAPASLLLLIFGLLLIHQSHDAWKFSQAWLSIGMLGWLISFVLGIAVLGPTAKKIASTIAAEGSESATASALIDRVLLIARIDIVILTLVVFDMVLKPGL